jgi:hypothetical protein
MSYTRWISGFVGGFGLAVLAWTFYLGQEATSYLEQFVEGEIAAHFSRTEYQDWVMTSLILGVLLIGLSAFLLYRSR